MNTLITIYHSNSGDPTNPLVKIHLVTTDDELAKANFDRMVSSTLADGYTAVNRYAGNQIDVRSDDGNSHMTIVRHCNTQPIEVTIGRGVW